MKRRKAKKEREEPYSRDELLDKLQHYCAYQDRCIFEIRDKLDKLEADEDDSDYVIYKLKEDRFWDEKRFAMNFVRSKWEIKNWGKIKIRKHLKAKRVASIYWDDAFAQIEEKEYLEIMGELGQRKWDQLPHIEKEFDRRKKVHDFLMGRGFEKFLVMDFIFTLKIEN